MTHVTVRPDGLLTVDQAAVLCDVSSGAIRAWTHRGHLSIVRRERGKILLNIVEVLRADTAARQNSRRPAAPPVTWHFEDEPEVDADVILRACMEAAAAAPSSVRSVVYYIRFGDRIKIGRTIGLRHRLNDLPHDELLATEPGGVNLECLRHAQFAEHRITGEWFRPAESLMTHIATLA